ncbi:MAG: DUF1232 domain-containing protein [Planctomycetaceae bacterium]|nr:DUF1232 domain-containing protein [Planctomycetaceae bacterium]MBQ2820017.1 DUF1232 domain-containing protein [Thermoguttaceae bacterium]
MSPPKPEDFVKGWNLVKVLRHLPEALGKARNLGAFVGDFQNMISLLQDYAAGRYRNVSKTTIALTTAAIAYVICPLDAVPDLLPFLGYGDDIAFLSATLLQIKTELGPYREWRRTQKSGKPKRAAHPHSEPQDSEQDTAKT